MAGKRLALIIGSSIYRDQKLAHLQGPDADVIGLAEVLRSPKIGAFDDVQLLVNASSSTVQRAISVFFNKKTSEDLLLLYFSGHGVLDEHGWLYLAVEDTETDLLSGGTAIPATHITNEMNNSPSQRQILILDCCHSGAFARGTKGSPGTPIGTREIFGVGSGRVVLTATDALQYAWEGSQIIGDAEKSLFTHFLVEGLQTGRADMNQDGEITIDELSKYVHDQVVQATSRQTPLKWSYKEQDGIIIAHNPRIADTSRPTPQAAGDEQLEDLYGCALEAFWVKDWEKAVALFSDLLERRPGYKDAQAKLDEAKRQRHLAGLYAQAAAQSKAGQWEAVIQIFGRIRAIQPDFPDPERLLPRATQELEALQKRQEMEANYRAALEAMNQGDWPAAKKMFQAVLRVDPSYKSASRLLERANAEIARQAAATSSPPAAPAASRLNRSKVLGGFLLILVGIAIFIITRMIQNGNDAHATPTLPAVVGRAVTQTPQPYPIAAGNVAVVPSFTPAQPAAALSEKYKAELSYQSIPDGTTLPPDTDFVVTWSFHNIGTAGWTEDYSLKFYSGEQFGAPDIIKAGKAVKAGETMDVTLQMRTPHAAGSYTSNWVLAAPDGHVFEPNYLIINVSADPGLYDNFNLPVTITDGNRNRQFNPYLWAASTGNAQTADFVQHFIAPDDGALELRLNEPDNIYLHAKGYDGKVLTKPYFLEASINIPQDTGDGAGWLIMRRGDFQFFLQYIGGKVSCFGGTKAPQELGQTAATSAQWHTLRIEVDPAVMTFTAYVDKIKICAGTPPEAEKFTTQGFTLELGEIVFASSGSPFVVQFDNVRIGPLGQ